MREPRNRGKHGLQLRESLSFRGKERGERGGESRAVSRDRERGGNLRRGLPCRVEGEVWLCGGYYEVSGIKIGWVSVNALSSASQVEKYVTDGINKLKEDNVDLILACCHWGIERDHYPTGYQKELGKKCIDLGADLVIGHHPHVLQGIDQYKGKLIIYSLGNFSFGANKNPSDKDTMIFQQTFNFAKITTGDGEVTITKLDDTDAKIIPCSISSVSSRNDYCPTPQTGDKGQRIINRVNTYSENFGVSANENGELQWTKENVSE